MDVRWDIIEGLLAYGFKQASIWTQMGKRFADEWYPILAKGGLSAEWPEEYLQSQVGHFTEQRTEATEVLDDDELEIEDELFD